MASWKESLLKVNNLSVKEFSLRHGFDRVFISTLASQLYCEIKIDFDVKYRPAPSSDQVIGTEIHDALIPTEKIDIEELAPKIESMKEFASIFPVFLVHSDLLITGITDGVYFRKGKPIYLFEIKSTKGSLDKVWPNEKFQAFLYALALEYMGFDLSSLLIVISKVKQHFNKQSLINELIESLDKKDDKILQNHPVKIHHFRYTKIEKLSTIKTLERLIPFWKETRNPHPSGNAAKCRPCPYKLECYYYKGLIG